LNLPSIWTRIILNDFLYGHTLHKKARLSSGREEFVNCSLLRDVTRTCRYLFPWIEFSIDIVDTFGIFDPSL
jgi:hypothetical protein